MSETALSLEGGSLRCLFTAGAVDLMMERGVRYDSVFGVSAGALSAANYVSGQIGRTAQVNLQFVNDKRYLGIRNLILHGSIFNFDFLFGELSQSLLPFDYDAFYSSPSRMTAIATNCYTGKPELFEQGRCDDIFTAIRASASMPLLAPMVPLNGIPYLDGGVSLSIPFRPALDQGCEKVVVITTREHGYRKPAVSPTMARLYTRNYRKYPRLIRSLLETPRRYAAELDELDRLEAAGKVFVIRPPKPVTVSRTEKDVEKLQALYDQGRAVCEQQWDALTAYLEK